MSVVHSHSGSHLELWRLTQTKTDGLQICGSHLWLKDRSVGMFHTHACSYGFSASTYGLKGHGIITTICIQSNAKFTSYSLQTEVMYGLLWQHHSALKHLPQHRLEVGLQVYPLEQNMSSVLVCPERLPRSQLHVQKIQVSLILIKLSNFKEYNYACVWNCNWISSLVHDTLWLQASRTLLEQLTSAITIIHGIILHKWSHSFNAAECICDSTVSSAYSVAV